MIALTLFLAALVMQYGGSSAGAGGGGSAVSQPIASGLAAGAIAAVAGSSKRRLANVALPSRATGAAAGNALPPPIGFSVKAAAGAADQNSRAKLPWPAQTLTLYTQADCRGENKVIANNHFEKRCSHCIDFCNKKFGSGMDLGRFVSYKVEGPRALVTFWANCKGTWKYPADSGFIGTTRSGDGCININSQWPPVHAQFHNLGQLRAAEHSAADSARAGDGANPYAKNPDHDRQSVYSRIAYWGRGGAGPGPVDTASLEPQPAKDKYITFLKDCGGFNNIRMGFEHAILMAWLTGRTLVLPPPEGWYLIDFGPIKRGGQYKKGQTDFSEFFDMPHLKNGMPVISAKEFYDRERDRLKLPPHFSGEALTRKNDKWKSFMFERFGGQAWTPQQNVICDPSISQYLHSSNKKENLLDRKKQIEFSRALLTKPVIHFPSCHGPNGDQGVYRYLGQIANAAVFADREREVHFKQFWKTHIHYPPQVFRAAAAMIAKMGLFAYSAVHIRRNDLQYKEVFQNAQATLRNIEPLLYPGETLYLATDETNDAFFDAIRQKHKIFQWKDVVAEARTIPYSEKVINILEQVICSGGRRFFGTQKSTFTSYIFRLRGYVGAPDTQQYWHNIRYTGIHDIDKFAIPKVTGHNYMMEDPGMWEDAKEA